MCTGVLAASAGAPGYYVPSTGVGYFAKIGADFYVLCSYSPTFPSSPDNTKILKITASGVVSVFYTLGSYVIGSMLKDDNGFLILMGDALRKISALGVSTTLSTAVGGFIVKATTNGYRILSSGFQEVSISGVVSNPYASPSSPYVVVHQEDGLRNIGVSYNNLYFGEAVNTASSKPYVKAS
jgi:hypothetical protein